MGYYRPPRRRNDDGSAEAAGCALFLITLGLALFARLFYEGSRYKPQPYLPAAPHLTQEPPRMSVDSAKALARSQWLAAISIVVTVLLIFQSNSSKTYSNNYITTIALVATFGIGTYVYVFFKQRQISQYYARIDHKSLFPRTPRTYVIYPPQAEANLSGGITLMQALLQAQPQLTFQIVADSERIVWQIVDPKGTNRPESIIATVRSHVPGATVAVEPTTGNRGAQSDKPIFRQHVFFKLANDYTAPIAFLDTLKLDDPLIPITKRGDFLRPDLYERMALSLVVLTASDVARQRGVERLEEGHIQPLAAVPNARQETNLHGLDEKLLNAKIAGPLYHAFFAISLESAREERLLDLVAVVPDVARFASPRHNQLVLSHKSPVNRVKYANIALTTTLADNLYADIAEGPNASWYSLLLVLHPGELAALWHLPDQRFTAERIAWASAPVADTLTRDGSDRVILGTTTGSGPTQKVYLGLADRAYHHYVTGKTGTGKSTLLHNLIHQDIAAGRGVAVLDPHGKLIADILATSIPANRQGDVVLLNLGDKEHPVPLNPFRVPPGTTTETAFTMIYWVMRKLYASVWRDRMDYVFRSVVQTLLTDSEATPRDISRMLLDVTYRQKTLARLDGGGYALQQFWSWYDQQPKSEMMEIASPILTRTGIFLSTQAVEWMTCHPHSLDMASYIRDRKIVLINLAGEAIQSEAGTLGAILLAQLFVAAQSLGYLEDGVLPRHYLYIDEVERFITSPIPEMFATSRKFGVSLTLANQYMKQLANETLEGIIGNVGTHLVFEVGDSDSRQLARLFEPEIGREELLKLGAYQMGVVTRANGKRVPAFRLKTLPPPPRGKQPAGTPIAAYAPLTAEEVRAWLDQRYRIEPPKPAVQATSSDGLTDYE